MSKLIFLSFSFIPLSIIVNVLHYEPLWQFCLAALAIMPLAFYMGKATEELACYTGPRLGGLLHATLGNATELIIGFFALRQGLYDVVKASLAGSVMGCILLVLGVSMFCGGVRYKIQSFNQQVVEVSSSMLTFAVIGLAVPAFFLHEVPANQLDTQQYEPLSLVIATIMLIIYCLSLYFSYVTHKDLFLIKNQTAPCPAWSIGKTITVLLLTTLGVSLESELLVAAIEPLTHTLGINEFFIGIIFIPLVGNAAEHSAAALLALKNKMDVAVEIAVGSCLQIVLFVMPVLVILGGLTHRPMSVVLNEFELVSLAVAVVIANRVARDGKSNWLEGIQLIAVYLIIAACFLWGALK